MMTVNQRITKIITELYSGNKRAFSNAIGVSAAVIENIVGKRQSSPSFDITNKILLSLDNINAEWLIIGKGQMLKTEDSSHTLPLEIQKKEYREETRPRIPMDAAAGSLTAAADGITIDDCEQLPVIKAFARYDFTIFARGDSMFPEYHSGDELACLYVKNTTFIQWGCCHVLDTIQGIVVKRIYDDGEYILCKSENSELFKDFRIHKTEVYNIALVIGLVRRY